MDINSITITGRATKDTELRTTNSGKNVATISVAVNGRQEEVSYFDVICWEKTAEIASQYITKGKQIAVDGRLQQRKWQDTDGANRYAVEIVANQLKLLGSSEGTQATAKSKDVILQDISDDEIDISSLDIPF